MLITRDEKGGWVCVLQPDNLARMKQGDPVTIPDLRLTICYEELPQEKLVKVLEKDGLDYLKRGWQNHPDDYAAPTVAVVGKQRI